MAGGLLARCLSAPFAQVGQILVLPALAYLLVALPHWRRRLAQGAILCAAFALPILAASCSGGRVVAIRPLPGCPYAGGNRSTGGWRLAAGLLARWQLPAWRAGALSQTVPSSSRNGPD